MPAMRCHPVFALVLVCVPFLLAVPVNAAPQPRDEGRGVVRLRSATFLAGWAYDDDGRKVDGNGFTTETVSVLVEAGVARRLTLTAALPFVWIPERGLPKAGDAAVGGLVSLLEPGQPLELAFSLELKLPLYQASPSRLGRSDDGLPALGDGQFDGTAGFVFSAPLPIGGALDLYSGYRLRAGGVTDAVVGGGRAGLWLLDKRIFFSLLLDSVFTLDAAPALGPDKESPEIVGRGYAAFGPRIHIRIVERTFFELGALYVGRGRNSAGGVEIDAGVSAAF